MEEATAVTGVMATTYREGSKVWALVSYPDKDIRIPAIVKWNGQTRLVLVGLGITEMHISHHVDTIYLMVNPIESVTTSISDEAHLPRVYLSSDHKLVEGFVSRRVSRGKGLLVFDVLEVIVARSDCRLRSIDSHVSFTIRSLIASKYNLSGLVYDDIIGITIEKGTTVPYLSNQVKPRETTVKRYLREVFRSSSVSTCRKLVETFLSKMIGLDANKVSISSLCSELSSDIPRKRRLVETMHVLVGICRTVDGLERMVKSIVDKRITTPMVVSRVVTTPKKVEIDPYPVSIANAFPKCPEGVIPPPVSKPKSTLNVTLPTSTDKERDSIPSDVRTEVWFKHNSNICFACDRVIEFSKTWHCASTSSHREGPPVISTLRPVCTKCFKSCGNKGLYEWMYLEDNKRLDGEIRVLYDFFYSQIARTDTSTVPDEYFSPETPLSMRVNVVRALQ